MNRNSIIQFINIFVGTSKQEDFELVAFLVSKGLNIKHAEQFVAFLPIAFGRVIIDKIAKVSFSNTCKVNETGREFSLSQEPIFLEAQKLADDSYQNSIISKEVFSAVAIRSAELVAVNKALNEGVDINGSSFGPVILFGYKYLTD